MHSLPTPKNINKAIITEMYKIYSRHMYVYEDYTYLMATTDQYKTYFTAKSLRHNVNGFSYVTFHAIVDNTSDARMNR